MKYKELCNRVFLRYFLSNVFSTKLLLMLNWTIILTLVLCIKVSANGYSQNNVSIDAKEIRIKRAFSMLEEKGNIRLLYSEEFEGLNNKVSINVDNTPVLEVLKMVLKDTGLKYRLFGDGLVVIVSDQKERKDIVVKGRVTDAANLAMTGVSIQLKGSTIGTTTDKEGNYILNVPQDGVLVFSYIGYLPQEIEVNNQSTINVKLEEDRKELNQVVVVGYGTQKKKDLLSAVSSIKGEEIVNLPVATPQSLIQGRASGVQVVQNSGAPGSAVTLRIRGTTSINAGNDPLYIVDGVPVESGSLTGYNGRGGTPPSALSAINADDIESMEVLKDAGALAIYGSRAANGVVLITTKRGKKGSTTYTLNYYTGTQQDNKSTRIKMLNSSQSIELIQEGRANALPYGTTALYGFILPDTLGNLANTDWQDEILRAAPISNYELAIRGGENKLRFSLSGNYFDQEGIIINSSYKRGNGRFNMDYDATDKFKFGSNISITKYINKRASTDDGGLSLIQVGLKKSPSMPLYNADGTLYNDDVSGFINPVIYAQRVKYENEVASLVGNVYGEYDILPELKFRTTFGLNYAGVLDTFFEPSDAMRNGVSSGVAFSSDVNGWINENTLVYSKALGKHSLTGLVGYSQQKRRSFAMNETGSQYATNNIYTLNAASIAGSVSSSVSANGLSSAFARIGYSFADKYLLEGTVRRDGSSRFGANKKYAMFPAISAAWRITNEGFWNKSSLINDLKLRGSVGRTGNQDIGDYVAQGQYNTGTRYIGQSGISLSVLPNQDLTWETTDQYNIGMDVSILNSRIALNVDAYVKKTSNLLLNVPLPGTTGFGSVLQNVGATENRGLEFNLDTRNIENPVFSWSTNFNVSFNRNKVVALNSGATEIILSKGAGLTGSLVSYSVLRVGEPIGSFYGWQSNGVYQYSTDNTTGLTSTSIGTTNYVYRGGDLIITDANGNNTIDNLDRMIIGRALPKFTGGLSNNFTYRNFDLNVLATFVYGNDMVNGTRYTTESDQRFSGNYNNLRRWRNEGDVTDIPRANAADPAGNRRFSNRWLEDGSYFRIKTATLGYKLPNTMLNRTPVKNCRIYATAQNLFTITNYTGYDPEASAMANGVTDIGIDQGTYPQYRSFIFGLSVGF